MDFDRKKEKHVIKKKIQDNKLPEEIIKKRLKYIKREMSRETVGL